MLFSTICAKLSAVTVDGEPLVPFRARFGVPSPSADFDHIFYAGSRRLYYEDLTEPDYLLEYATPYQLTLFEYTFTERAWGNLLSKAADALLTLHPEKLPTLFGFRCDWTKQAIFFDKERTNCKKVRDGIYVNVNHTALHSCWLLGEMLDFFGVDRSDAILLLYRPSGAELKEVKSFLTAHVKGEFERFLLEKGESDSRAKLIISTIDEKLNPLLRKISQSYDDLFLIDDLAIYSTCMSRVKKEVEKTSTIHSLRKPTVLGYLDLLGEFLHR